MIDGDTVVILADTGFGSRMEATIRVAGIDAPEMGTDEGAAAWRYLWHHVLGAAFAAGAAAWPLLVTTRKTRNDADVRSFTRYVGDVAIGGRDVAGMMVLAGHATVAE